MIKYIDSNKQYEEIKNTFSGEDTFLTRLNVLFTSYGVNESFLDFWYQVLPCDEDSKAVSLIARLDSDFILCLTEKSDLNEIQEFLNILNFSSVLFNNKYALNLVGDSYKIGCILKRKNIDFKNNNSLLEIKYNYPYKELFSFFNNCNSDDVKIKDYGSFATDLNCKIKGGCGKTYCLVENSEILSACITTFDSVNTIISPVATLENMRKKGYATHLINSIKAENICVYCSDDYRADVYTKMGFVNSGEWKEVYR